MKHHFVVISYECDDFTPQAAFDTKEEAIAYADSFVDKNDFAMVVYVYDMWAAPANETGYKQIYKRML